MYWLKTAQMGWMQKLSKSPLTYTKHLILDVILLCTHTICTKRTQHYHSHIYLQYLLSWIPSPS